MTVSGINHFSHSSAVLDTSGQLALLVLESQEQQQASHLQDLALARERFVVESNEQVEAMHDQADAIRRGAVFQAGASCTAATIQIVDFLEVPDKGKCEGPIGEISAGLADGLSEPLGKWLGDAPAADAAADAQQHATQAQQAEWQLSDAKDAIKRSDNRQDQALQWLSGEISSEAQANAAIIGGYA
ncbi:MAG TPA: hypothetical protein VIW29_06075 [Polyangiaceae bacterium]